MPSREFLIERIWLSYNYSSTCTISRTEYRESIILKSFRWAHSNLIKTRNEELLMKVSISPSPVISGFNFDLSAWRVGATRSENFQWPWFKNLQIDYFHLWHRACCKHMLWLILNKGCNFWHRLKKSNSDNFEICM